jgi:hypothetical protein
MRIGRSSKGKGKDTRRDEPFLCVSTSGGNGMADRGANPVTKLPSLFD